MKRLCKCIAIERADHLLSQPYVKNGIWRVTPLSREAVECQPAGSLLEATRNRRDIVAVMALELIGFDLDAAYDWVDDALRHFRVHPEASVDYVVTCALEIANAPYMLSKNARPS